MIQLFRNNILISEGLSAEDAVKNALDNGLTLWQEFTTIEDATDQIRQDSNYKLHELDMSRSEKYYLLRNSGFSVETSTNLKDHSSANVRKYAYEFKLNVSDLVYINTIGFKGIIKSIDYLNDQYWVEFVVDITALVICFKRSDLVKL